MKRLIATAILLLMIPVFASAQDTDHHYPWQAYTLFGVGTGSVPRPFYIASPHDATEQLAFGGEGISKIGLGMGFEMGWTHWRQDQPWERTPSVYISFHYPKVIRRRIEPFVEVGGTLMYFQDHDSRGSGAANFGGGVNLWVRKHMALRFDVKGFHQNSQIYGTYPNLLEFRVGVTFR